MNQLRPSSQEQLKILTQTDSKFLKDAFWRFANLRSQKELKEDFVIDDENREQVAAFVAYFSNDHETMIKLGVDSRKGIMLIGNPGSGKSMLFRIMRDILKSDKIAKSGERDIPLKHFYRKFDLYTCEHMGKLYMAQGEQSLAPFGRNAVIFDGKEVINLKHVCFDDLGNEEIRNNYGNKKEVMVDIISERYDLFLEYGLLTHFTSNLTADEISDRYSDRIRSRLRQMCNIITIGNTKNYKDRR